MAHLNPQRVALALLAPAALLAGASGAQAHAHLMGANPAPNATVSGGTRMVALHFNEGVMARFSGVDLTTANGQKLATSSVTVAPKDNKTLVATLKAPLARGMYKVSWHAVTADTHRVQGGYAFKVR